MKPGPAVSFARTCRAAALAAFAAALAVPYAVSAEGPPPPAIDAPPPPPAAPSASDAAASPPAPAAGAPRTDVAADAAAQPDQKEKPRIVAQPDVRFEEHRRGRHLVEIVVTPAHTTYSYTILNLEGQPPRSVLETSPGLSVPRFWRFDF
jgi:hypothetical protein